MDDPFLTDYERGQADMLKQASAELLKAGRITAAEVLETMRIQPDQQPLTCNEQRRRQRMAEYGPFPQTVGTYSVEAMLTVANIADARAPGGVSPAGTAIYALLRLTTQLEGKA